LILLRSSERLLRTIGCLWSAARLMSRSILLRLLMLVLLVQERLQEHVAGLLLLVQLLDERLVQGGALRVRLLLGVRGGLRGRAAECAARAATVQVRRLAGVATLVLHLLVVRVSEPDVHQLVRLLDNTEKISNGQRSASKQHF
jgi:hypothetical protein